MPDNTSEYDNCEVDCPHMEAVEELTPRLLDSDTAYSLAEFFRVFGDATRIKIIQALSIRELCVCDITELLGVSQSNVSHQLKILRQFKLVKPRKEGKMVFYSLSDQHVEDIFGEGLEHIRE